MTLTSMDSLNGHKWFEYELMDAWGNSLARVTVLNADKNIVLFSLRDEPCTWFPSLHYSSVHTAEIDDAAMLAIIDIVSDRNLYRIKNRKIGVACIDGYEHRFYFSDGERQFELRGSNLAMCLDHIAEYPNVEQVLHVLEQIRKILVPQGVDSRCLSLTKD